MSTAYEPNIQGAIAVLRDLMIANSFTMTREPYEPNYRGLVDAVIDLKEGFPTFAPLQVGFDATAFENVSEGYLQSSGRSSADIVLSPNATVKVIVIGLKTMSGLDAGDLYFLSPSTAGAITLTPPSSAGQAVVRVGEASTATKFAIRIEPPIKLS